MGNGQDSVIKFFTQCPNLILYGLPDVAIQDKWALLALVGICWDRSKSNKTLRELEGPYKLSLREIASITGVKHNALRRTEGKNPRDGVLDRLQDIGYITINEGKPMNRLTGGTGRTQTYLYIHLERLWRDNLIFAETYQVTSRLVPESSFVQIVDGETVHAVNDEGHSVNSTVNNDVHQSEGENHTVNDKVHGSRMDLVPIQDKTESHTEINTDASSSIDKLPNLLNLRMRGACRRYQVEYTDAYKGQALELFRRVQDEEAFKIHIESAQKMSTTIEQFFDNLAMLTNR